MDLAHVSLKASLPRRSISGERALFLLAILDMRHAGSLDDQMSLVGHKRSFGGPTGMSAPGGRADEISAITDIGQQLSAVAAAQRRRQRHQTKRAHLSVA